jgi:hypothetical protein
MIVFNIEREDCLLTHVRTGGGFRIENVDDWKRNVDEGRCVKSTQDRKRGRIKEIRSKASVDYKSGGRKKDMKMK